MERKRGFFFSLLMPAARKLSVKIRLKMVVRGHFVLLAALFVQPHPPALTLPVIAQRPLPLSSETKCNTPADLISAG